MLTDLPLRGTIHKPNLSGRMARWAMELNEYGIQYKPSLFKKGQVLADFLAKLPQPNKRPNSEGWWTLHIDGVSNNESEYEALIVGVELALAVGADSFLVLSDSQVVVGQINAEFESREPRMTKYAFLAKQKLNTLTTWKLRHIPRDHNERADALAAVAASLPIKEMIYLLFYYKQDSSILHDRISQVQEAPPSWMDPIILYITTGELPEDKSKAHKIRIQSAWFSIIDGQLYKRSLNGLYLKCLTPKQSQYVLAELHEGICGNHPRGRTLAHRAHTQGYYWPTKKTDAADYVRKCDPCQRMSPILKSPVQDLISFSSPWPFAQWRIYIEGPFPIAPAQKKILLVATDYFSKWIKAEAYASIKDRDVTRFIWKNIVCRFGIPKSIISDNGPQFDSRVY